MKYEESSFCFSLNDVKDFFFEGNDVKDVCVKKL